MSPGKVAFWLTKKKLKKWSLEPFRQELCSRNLELVEISNVDDLENKGPFEGIVHKLTDFLFLESAGDEEGTKVMKKIEEFAKTHPTMAIIDQFDCLRKLMDRYNTCLLLASCPWLKRQETVFIPPFLKLASNNFKDNVKLIQESNLTFPMVCKPLPSHGSQSAHQMTLVFDEAGLLDITYPCLIQSFVNHDAILYKLYVIGKVWKMVERPSIKNLSASKSQPSIYFNATEVSKPNSCSKLTLQDDCDMDTPDCRKPPNNTLIEQLVYELSNILRIGLFGIDIVVENGTQRVAIVDVNVFPSYEGVEKLPEKLANYIEERLSIKEEY